jgi:NAD(P)-dependent dehydrogenase (short-subunit alcohol dehydrogenase family)
MGKGKDLQDQVVVVTGAARGVGRQLARELAAHGARIALIGLEPEELQQVAQGLPTDSGYWYADVTDAEAMTEVAGKVVEHFGTVDAVVANAGVALGGPFLDCDASSFNRVLEVNLLGSANTARAFLPALLESHGYLLQIASLAAMTPTPMMAAYCASKSGVEAFAHCLRAEVGHQGVTVGVAYLSWTDTDMVRGADEDDVLRELRRRLPWPANRTYPLRPAVERLVAGIERRSPHVYAQGWLRGLQGIRGYLPGIIGTAGQREMRRFAPQLSADRETPIRLVGAGGAADEQAQAEQVQAEQGRIGAAASQQQWDAAGQGHWNAAASQQAWNQQVPQQHWNAEENGTPWHRSA